jgi:hypothetical protein
MEIRAALRRSLFLGVLGLVLSATAGCGGKGTVSGKVTLDGEPLPAGTITFQSKSGKAASGAITDGQYSVPGVPTGEVSVSVETATVLEKSKAAAQGYAIFVKNRQMPTAESASKMPPEAKARFEEEDKRGQNLQKEAEEWKAKYRFLPDKYSKPETSGLTTKVSGSTTYDVPLSTK